MLQYSKLAGINFVDSPGGAYPKKHPADVLFIFQKNARVRAQFIFLKYKKPFTEVKGFFGVARAGIEPATSGL